MASSSLLTLLCLVAASLAQDCYWPAGASHSARCYKDHYCLCFEHGQDVQVAIVRELLLRNLSISARDPSLCESRNFTVPAVSNAALRADVANLFSTTTVAATCSVTQAAVEKQCSGDDSALIR
ncbi:hypothetical protein E4U14_001539 [Claviceps sp. LM454 group G7]|nr:hypothetical protein E4U14_001539 [Claviceps sp. LM454 group G7]